MNIITGIQETRGIVEISADGGGRLKVRKEHFAKNPLEVEELVDLDAYENTIASLQFSDAYEAALTALDHSARTATELKRSLLRKGYVPTAIAAVIERLTENRLIDDRKIANRIAETTVSKSVGIYAVKRKLHAKGISEEDFAEALESFDDEQQRIAARETAKKLYRKYSALPVREARMKLSQALARRGFAWENVREAVDSIMNDDCFEDDYME